MKLGRLLSLRHDAFVVSAVTDPPPGVLDPTLTREELLPLRLIVRPAMRNRKYSTLKLSKTFQRVVKNSVDLRDRRINEERKAE